MKELDEDVIYDAVAAISEFHTPLALHINGITDQEQRRVLSKAYTSGVYTPAIRLQWLLSDVAMERGKQRHAKIKADVREYFQGHKANVRDHRAGEAGSGASSCWANVINTSISILSNWINVVSTSP